MYFGALQRHAMNRLQLSVYSLYQTPTFKPNNAFVSTYEWVH